MQITITPGAMRALEKDYMALRGVPGALLMEHAAQAVCGALERRIPGGRALFVCGPGNNGGDGYTAARLWRAVGGEALVWELSAPAGGDAAMNRALALEAGVTILPPENALPPCDAAVDALFGTGLSRPVEGRAADVIRLLNESGLPVIAVDIPSGLCGETGRVLGEAVRAAETVTFHRLKPGLLLRDGPRCAGKLTVAPILIPDGFGTQEGLRCLEKADIARFLPPRPVDGHKGTFGRVAIFAGSLGMAGAAALCASAAIRAGAGLTTVLCREEILPMVQVLCPGAVCVPYTGAESAMRLLATADAAAVGCGLGQAEDALPALQAFRAASCPVVWDADALNLLARHDELLPLPGNAVITPHPGEAARLLGSMAAEITDAPLESLQALRDKCGCTVLLKGCRTLMTDGVHTAVNLQGTPALAKGGSGDVLTGLMVALLARRLPCTALEAVQLASMLHGLAGLRGAMKHGENCLTPTELAECIRLDAEMA